MYNITAGEGVLGVEIRPIPEDDVHVLVEEVRSLTRELGAELDVLVEEPVEGDADSGRQEGAWT